MIHGCTAVCRRVALPTLATIRFGLALLITAWPAATPLGVHLLGGSGIGIAADPPAAPQVPADLDPRVATRAPGVRLELVGEHPDIVTPTGIDVDGSGRIWIVACHTHFRPTGYEGP
ncbi:MAG: hypothetical protein ACKO35_08915, partial [Planctomycetaceae bacterium]